MPKTSEEKRIDLTASFYTDGQLDFDRALIGYRYRTLKPHLQGPYGLELGSAEGVMTQMLVHDFDHLTIVDGAKTLLDMVPAHPNLTKIHALFEDFVPSHRFNTVIIEHVLEHVADPVALMRKAATWAAPGAVLCLGVPNGHSFHRLAAVKMGILKNPCDLNERDQALGHRRVYTPDTFRADIEHAGLTIQTMGGVFFKPLSNGQIQNDWTPQMIEGFYQLGHDFPENAAEIFAICTV